MIEVAMERARLDDLARDCLITAVHLRHNRTLLGISRALDRPIPEHVIELIAPEAGSLSLSLRYPIVEAWVDVPCGVSGTFITNVKDRRRYSEIFFATARGLDRALFRVLRIDSVLVVEDGLEIPQSRFDVRRAR